MGKRYHVPSQLKSRAAQTAFSNDRNTDFAYTTKPLSSFRDYEDEIYAPIPIEQPKRWATSGRLINRENNPDHGKYRKLYTAPNTLTKVTLRQWAERGPTAQIRELATELLNGFTVADDTRTKWIPKWTMMYQDRGGKEFKGGCNNERETERFATFTYIPRTGIMHSFI